MTISYAAKIPLKSVALALRGSESEHGQDALRVLDIVLRQQQAKRYAIFCHCKSIVRYFYLSFWLPCAYLLYTEGVYLLGSHFSVMTVETLWI